MKKILVNYIVTLFSLIITTSFNTEAKVIKDKEEEIEWMICRKVFNLKEIKFDEAHLHKLKGNKAHLSIIIEEKPTLKSPYYELKLGYDREDKFEVYFLFRINKKYIWKKYYDKYIEVFGGSEGDYIPMLKYRKEMKKNDKWK